MELSTVNLTLRNPYVKFVVSKQTALLIFKQDFGLSKSLTQHSISILGCPRIAVYGMGKPVVFSSALNYAKGVL